MRESRNRCVPVLRLCDAARCQYGLRGKRLTTVRARSVCAAALHLVAWRPGTRQVLGATPAPANPARRLSLGPSRRLNPSGAPCRPDLAWQKLNRSLTDERVNR